MVSQTGPRVVRSNFSRGQIYPGKEPKGQQVLFGTKFLKFDPKNGQPGNPDSYVQHCELYIGSIV